MQCKLTEEFKLHLHVTEKYYEILFLSNTREHRVT